MTAVILLTISFLKISVAVINKKERVHRDIKFFHFYFEFARSYNISISLVFGVFSLVSRLFLLIQADFGQTHGKIMGPEISN